MGRWPNTCGVRWGIQKGRGASSRPSTALHDAPRPSTIVNDVQRPSKSPNDCFFFKASAQKRPCTNCPGPRLQKTAPLLKPDLHRVLSRRLQVVQHDARCRARPRTLTPCRVHPPHRVPLQRRQRAVCDHKSLRSAAPAHAEVVAAGLLHRHGLQRVRRRPQVHRLAHHRRTRVCDAEQDLVRRARTEACDGLRALQRGGDGLRLGGAESVVPPVQRDALPHLQSRGTGHPRPWQRLRGRPQLHVHLAVPDCTDPDRGPLQGHAERTQRACGLRFVGLRVQALRPRGHRGVLRVRGQSTPTGREGGLQCRRWR